MKQLNLLLNNLLTNEETLPYSFFIEEQELTSSVGEHLQKNKVSHVLLRHLTQTLQQTQLSHAPVAITMVGVARPKPVHLLHQCRCQSRQLCASSISRKPSSESAPSADVQPPCRDTPRLCLQSISVPMGATWPVAQGTPLSGFGIWGLSYQSTHVRCACSCLHSPHQQLASCNDGLNEFVSCSPCTQCSGVSVSLVPSLRVSVQ